MENAVIGGRSQQKKILREKRCRRLSEDKDGGKRKQEGNQGFCELALSKKNVGKKPATKGRKRGRKKVGTTSRSVDVGPNKFLELRGPSQSALSWGNLEGSFSN